MQGEREAIFLVGAHVGKWLFTLARRSFAMVVAQQSAESFATDDIAIGPTDSIVRFEEIVAQALVVPFVMIMRQVLVNRVSQ